MYKEVTYICPHCGFKHTIEVPPEFLTEHGEIPIKSIGMYLEEYNCVNCFKKNIE